jgi:fructose-bisphosphate aldolase class II
MPVATPDQYNEMLDRAKKGGFAYPAINVSSSQTLNAALAGLQAAGSDGIIQVTTGGGDYWSGPTIKNMASGAAAMAAFAREVAKNYGITIALHTDHCAKGQLDSFVRPLIAISQERVRAGQDPLFNSHMWDGSAVSLTENLEIAQEMLKLTNSIGAVLEVEIGVVGGEEDGVEGGEGEHLYTTPEDGLLTVEALGLGENGRYMAALTFGNVHGVYKPGNVKLRPELLGEIQKVVGAKYGKDKPFDLVFHGGSGSTPEEIAEAVRHGVIKMNIDTDLQYAFTRPIAAHMFQNYDGVLKVDGEVGNKKAYDPRAWGKIGEAGMSARVIEAAQELGSHGKSMSL